MKIRRLSNVANISEHFGDMRKVPTKFFKPVTVREILELRRKADRYITY